ncbi:MAG: hypothetical protein A2452_12365 [Candidatus Firestonebacteria bacterium RIFOXYC2_FULL_39_67]|nr:MAG: hypothetical protein A2536_07895 [Candidatus Firestonebacteria bacterium RIFOXYD2_FULL_39_29]OGF55641.1 MAG: hypothetical protein A2452_12365 [Candidatus Firestonebacteria bacterium RIFOXYC2_FULL_39_67]OGF57564.1 MAG: hypothetical protein A2497_01325 [Candidatus Firestonebacteria bacterium RifOxyC12_full_39_7]
MKKFRYITAVLLFASVSFYAEDSELLKLTGLALENNQEIKSLKEMVKTLEITSRKESALEEPKIGAGIVNLPANSLSFNEEDMTMLEFKFMQMLPFPGKLGLMGLSAGFNVKIAEQELVKKKNEIKENVSKAYYDIVYLNKALDISEKNKQLLMNTVAIADEKYRSGTAMQSDVLKAQVEVSRMGLDINMLKQEKHSALALLSALLNEKKEITLENTVLERNKTEINEEKVIAIALEDNPELKIAALGVEKNKADLDVAGSRLLPDFNLSLSYGLRQDNPVTGMKRSGMITLMLDMSLPFLWGSAGFEVKENEAEKEVKKAVYENTTNTITSMLKEIVSRISKNRANIELYESGILPQSRQNINISQEGYKSGKLDFLTLLDSQMTLYKYELEYYRELAEHQKNFSGMETLLGGEYK